MENIHLSRFSHKVTSNIFVVLHGFERMPSDTIPSEFVYGIVESLGSIVKCRCHTQTAASHNVIDERRSLPGADS